MIALPEMMIITEMVDAFGIPIFIVHGVLQVV
jgi:hypothetical protein